MMLMLPKVEKQSLKISLDSIYREVNNCMYYTIIKPMLDFRDVSYVHCGHFPIIFSGSTPFPPPITLCFNRLIYISQRDVTALQARIHFLEVYSITHVYRFMVKLIRRENVTERFSYFLSSHYYG